MTLPARVNTYKAGVDSGVGVGVDYGGSESGVGVGVTWKLIDSAALSATNFQKCLLLLSPNVVVWMQTEYVSRLN